MQHLLRLLCMLSASTAQSEDLLSLLQGLVTRQLAGAEQQGQ
jgi:hypothetical protein